MKAAAARTRNAAKATYARVAPIVANRARNVGCGYEEFWHGRGRQGSQYLWQDAWG